uniref:LEF-2 protein n=1 Tax=Fopius arisanus TaxID=64838 RepID=A0A0C9Q0Q2_9HYME
MARNLTELCNMRDWNCQKVRPFDKLSIIIVIFKVNNKCVRERRSYGVGNESAVKTCHGLRMRTRNSSLKRVRGCKGRMPISPDVGFSIGYHDTLGDFSTSLPIETQG